MDIVLAIEICTALIGVILYDKYRKSSLRLWIVLLILAPLAEVTGNWYSEHINYNNHIVFNTYDILSQLILFYMIYQSIEDPGKRKAIVLIIGATLALFVVNSFYASPVTESLILYSVTATAFTIFALGYYLIDLLQSDAILTFRRNLPFLVFTGYLIFHIVYLPITITYRFIVLSDQESTIIYPVLQQVLGSTIILVNLLFIVSIFWTKPLSKQVVE